MSRVTEREKENSNIISTFCNNKKVMIIESEKIQKEQRVLRLFFDFYHL